MKIHNINLLSILTNAIGITAKAGRYGGTYAHKDIAYHFGMWISPRFQLLLIKEYQHLQELTPLQVSLVYANEACQGSVRKFDNKNSALLIALR